MLSGLNPIAQFLWPSTIVVGVIVIIVFGWRFPKYFFWLVFLLRPLVELSRIAAGQGDLVRWIVNASGVVIPCVLLIVLVLHLRISIAPNIFLLAFVGFIALSSLVHDMNGEAREIGARLVIPLILWLFPQTALDSEDDVKTLLRVIAVSTVIVLVAVFLDRARTNVNPVHGWIQDAVSLKSGEVKNRLGAVFGVPTLTAFWLFPFFAVSYFLFETERSFWRWLGLGLCIGLSCPLFLTFSRAVWLACWLLIFSYNLMKGRLGKTTAWVLGSLSLAAIVVPDILLRFKNLTNIKGRFVYWAGYLKTMKVKGLFAWLTGLGWSDLPQKNIFTGDLFSPGATGLVENSFLFIFVGGGVLALTAFLFLVVDLARKAWGLRRSHESTFIGHYGTWTLSLLGAWLVMSMTGDMVLYAVVNWYWYAFFGCALALWTKRREGINTSAVGPQLFLERDLTRREG